MRRAAIALLTATLFAVGAACTGGPLEERGGPASPTPATTPSPTPTGQSPTPTPTPTPTPSATPGQEGYTPRGDGTIPLREVAFLLDLLADAERRAARAEAQVQFLREQLARLEAENRALREEIERLRRGK